MDHLLVDKKKVVEKMLALDVKVATGCTEPVTIALAVLYACRELTGEQLQKLTIRPSINLFKNAMEVGIPGTDYNHGVPLAAALGAVLAREKGITPGLNILSKISQCHFTSAKSLVSAGTIAIEIDYATHGLSVEAMALDHEGNTIVAVIKDGHDTLIKLEKNGQSLLTAKAPSVEGPQSTTGAKEQTQLTALRKELAALQYADIVSILPHLSEESRRHLLEGVTINSTMVENAISNSRGILKIGQAYNKLFKVGDKKSEAPFINQAIATLSAAVDARMSGFDMPVMTSAGSGNQGLTITLPLKIFAEVYQLPENILCEALALGHLTTSIAKAHTGTLSAMCGCVVCAGLGLASALTYLMNYQRNAQQAAFKISVEEVVKELECAIDIMVASVTGIICDGAKVGCSVKAVCSVSSAYHAAMLASSNIKIPETNGVLGSSIESTLSNLGKIASPGMIATDEQILSIMINR
ncbi:MAG: serine dehydratase subunit alpha family protein [Oligoflexia bacterium]|nr:serine dehydratase subunit alpha family protein [Oligoflexia bacterium]MBF0366146.1 serine dehydratase subunit alpha family protein [Oligoflexia bacterium]